MFTVDEMLKAVDEYQRERMSLEAFERWFEDNSAMEFADEQSDRIRAAVDAALAELHFDRIGEQIFRRELANSIRPFVPRLERVSNQLFRVKSARSFSTPANAESGNTRVLRKPQMSERESASATFATSFQRVAAQA